MPHPVLDAADQFRRQALAREREAATRLVQTYGRVYRNLQAQQTALEQALAPRGFTLRHFPQSFEFSTLGGWIATRSGGHYATVYTHIDEFVEAEAAEQADRAQQKQQHVQMALHQLALVPLAKAQLADARGQLQAHHVQ